MRCTENSTSNDSFMLATVLSNCVRLDKVCSNVGDCINGTCQCPPGTGGTYCDPIEHSDDSTNRQVIYATIIAIVVPCIIIVCLLLLLIVLLAVLLRPKDRAWAVDFAEIELKQQIGAGGYGAVHKAVWKESDVAVKLLANPNGLTRDIRRNFV
eukprot:TRINITY_DN5760_c1_g1_i1.p1 TRINITY_DN5760_c1_g1~~TRINITY_DN5760_c1_g1_i1.p1  ORF type:complete len:154 (+),score=19.68 TRINITY_DN5760_c1_g1_i1:1-462(+)